MMKIIFKPTFKKHIFWGKNSKYLYLILFNCGIFGKNYKLQLYELGIDNIINSTHPNINNVRELWSNFTYFITNNTLEYFLPSHQSAILQII